MKIDKTALTLGISGVASLAILAAASLTGPKRKKQKGDFEIEKSTEWVLDCLDEMVMDIKQFHREQDEHEKRLAKLEARIDNVNIRVDSVMDGN